MAGWTDYCPDWSSKDKLRLCSVYDALSALTTAVNERGSVLNSYTPLPTVNMLYPVKYYVDLIDSTIKSIVPQFVNHTISDGDFTGLEAIPMWTNGAIREYGLRPDGTQKEMGFLGEIICAEDPEIFFTEISVGFTINGVETDVPSLVPTLTDTELNFMVTEGYKEGAQIPEAILAKALAHAQSRIAAGQSPFASDGEQTYRAGFNYRHSRLMPVVDWVYQQYEIINKLRWRTGNFEWNTGEDFPDGLQPYKLARYNDSVSYDSIVADYNASAWGREDADYYWYGLGHLVDKAITGTGYRSRVWRGRMMRTLQFSDMDSAMDCYCKFSGYADGYGRTNYVNNDYPNAQENKMYRLESDVNAQKETQIVFTVCNFNNCSALESDLILHSNESMYFGGYGVAGLPGGTGGYNGGYYVRKFTGTNGFQFKDW